MEREQINFLILVAAVYFISKLGIDSFDKFVRVLDVAAWPIVALMAMLFFQKVFAYMFFSMEEFNFFGAKGRLKNVRELIREKAIDLHRNLQQEAKLKKDQEKKQSEIDKLKKETEDKEAILNKVFVLADRLIDERQLVLDKITASSTGQINASELLGIFTKDDKNQK